MKMNREFISQQVEAKQQALATLGLYALEKNELNDIMNRAIDISCIVLKLDCAVIFTLNKNDDEVNTITIGAQAGCAEVKDPITVEDKWDIGYALANEDPVIVNSYKEDNRFHLSPFLKEEDIESSVNIVVKGAADRYGLLGFYTHERREFTEHEINFMQIVANIVGMAIERDRNRKDLQKNNKRLQNEMERNRKFQREILNNSVAQRWELGSYLHDNLAQSLASAQIIANELNDKIRREGMEVGEEISQLKEILADGLAGIRNLSHDIIPVDMEEEGVAHAFQYLIQQTEKLHGVKCELRTREIINDITNIELATNLYHIVQEAVKNAALHGKADTVAIAMSKQDKILMLRVEDDGKGFSETTEKEMGKGKGIRIMQHRVELMGGDFKIEGRGSGGGSGTVITCAIPLKYLTNQ